MGHAEIFIFTNTNARGGMRQISAAENRGKTESEHEARQWILE